MATAFIGQIEIFAAGVVPRGWATCAGQLLSIAQNQALYSLLGTAYGGDGRTNFALPDLRGRVPIGLGGDYSAGQRGGEEAHTLTAAELPAHSHGLMADASATPTGSMPSSATVLGRSIARGSTGGTFTANLYGAGTPNVALNNVALQASRGGQAHENRMPSLALNFCICIDPRAVYPTRG